MGTNLNGTLSTRAYKQQKTVKMLFKAANVTSLYHCLSFSLTHAHTHTPIQTHTHNYKNKGGVHIRQVYQHTGKYINLQPTGK